ncbi:MAG: 50S ribosomal protein L10 [archaeon]
MNPGKTTEAHVSDRKMKQVSELEGLIKEKNTVLLVSIKGIPASQYQELVKRFRSKAVVKVPKKSIISRALDSSDKEGLKELRDKVGDSTAILFSDDDAFDISVELLEKKTSVRAKAGQIAPEDIVVDAGPTELMPGPAITELGALGIKIQIDKGKISIKESKTILRKGEKISSAAADVMGKLDIKPFSIGFVPIAAFDSKENKVYFDINVDKESILSELKNFFGMALPFAVDIGYVCGDTIKFILSKAVAYGNALGKLAEQPKEETPKIEESKDEDSKSEKKGEEVKEEPAGSGDEKKEDV